MTAAMVLCAGLGTRLRPLTLELPKPLVPIGDRPLLGHILERLRRLGVDRAIVNTHHIHDAFHRYVDGLGSKVQLIHEPEIRGTAGGVRGALDQLGPPPILVWNGDILAPPPLGLLSTAAHQAGMCLAVAPLPEGRGTVGVDGTGRVVRLRGERFGVESAGADYVGIAALGAGVLPLLPQTGCLIGDVALPLLRRGEPIQTVPIDGPWTDLGSLESYAAANLSWLGPDREAYAARDARIASGVRLDRSIIGSGVVVEGDGRVTRCIAWPGAKVRAPLSDAIVTSAGRLVSLRPQAAH